MPKFAFNFYEMDPRLIVASNSMNNRNQGRDSPSSTITVFSTSKVFH